MCVFLQVDKNILLGSRGRKEIALSNQDFHTFRDYMSRTGRPLTASMEDYLEMIYRLSSKSGYTRINKLAGALNVQPPAVTRMVQKLAELKLVRYERYGVVSLMEPGFKMGASLLKRHDTVEKLLRVLGVSEEHVLEETEKIEHTITEETLKCFYDFAEFIQGERELIDRYNSYRAERE